MTLKDKPVFGHALRSKFFLEPDYTPLNHGSFGVTPRCIHPILHELQQRSEVHPDRWLRREMFPLLQRNLDRLASLVHCDLEELVFVANATYGVNSVVRSLPLTPGDKVLCFNTLYNAVERTMAFLKDARQAELVIVDLAYPLTDQEILNITREVIEREVAKGGSPLRMAMFDAISSVPGVRFPYEAMVKLVREYGILSVVDGAHAIGQIPLNLHESDPDFFITNCHKWLYSPRASALLYVPKRNQHLVHPSLINAAYKDHSDPSDRTSTFQAEFAWPGTNDFSAFMCIEAALNFRESLGGETAIQEYCNKLALDGGKVVAEIFGTEVLENEEGTLTVHMVNVRLPLSSPKIPDEKVPDYFIDKLIYEHNTCASVYKHAGRWYVRMSAQTYLEVDDFKYCAEAILKVCKELESI